VRDCPVPTRPMEDAIYHAESTANRTLGLFPQGRVIEALRKYFAEGLVRYPAASFVSS